MGPLQRPALSHDEQAYQSYIGFCSRVDVAPLDFEKWTDLTTPEEGADSDA